jgi:hypothetical protein
LAAGVAATTGRTLDAARLRVQDLDSAIVDAEAWQHRRAAKSAVDRAQYRLGGAFAPGGRLLDIDDVHLAGLDALGGTALALLAVILLQHPQDSLSAAICRLQRTRAGRMVRNVGVWARAVWLSDLYRAVVIDFETSAVGRDPDAGWRRLQPTVRQQYLALELARLNELALPAFRTRGEAHIWLQQQGGRADILTPPPLPPLPTTMDVVR